MSSLIEGKVLGPVMVNERKDPEANNTGLIKVKVMSKANGDKVALLRLPENPWFPVKLLANGVNVRVFGEIRDHHNTEPVTTITDRITIGGASFLRALSQQH